MEVAMLYVLLFFCIAAVAVTVWCFRSRPERAAQAEEVAVEREKYRRYRRKQPGDFTIHVVKESEHCRFSCGPLEVFESADEAYQGALELIGKWKARGDSMAYTHVEIYRYEPCPTCETMRHVQVEKRQLA